MNEAQIDLVMIFIAFAIAMIAMNEIDKFSQHRGAVWRLWERKIVRPMARNAAWAEIRKKRDANRITHH